MGLRGPQKTPTKIWKLNGKRDHRSRDENEVQYPPGVPDKPAGMSAGAKRIWDALVFDMAPSGVLRTVDGYALAQLCEDQASLDELRIGLSRYAREIARQAKAKKQNLPGGPMVYLSRTSEGRRTLSTIRELSAQVIVQRREFGLTPSSATRVNADGGGGVKAMFDPLERELCG